jgi:glycosyltransferase involved in cell wall biosynthesis
VDVLIVSSYPSGDDPAAYRFVADQATAIAGAGATPWIATFDRINLAGDAVLRARQESAIAALRRRAVSQGEGRRGTPTPFQLIDGVPVARLAVPHGPDRPGHGSSAADRRAEALMDLAAMPGRPRWSIVHAHMGYPEGDAAARLAASLSIPFVLTEHNRFVATQLAVPAVAARYRHAIGSAARVVTVSQMLASELGELFPQAADRIRVVPNTVSVDDFRCVGPGERDARTLLYVGYRKESKGIPVLLDAMGVVHARRPDLQLHLVGSSSNDDEEQRWVRRIAELGLGDAVHLDPAADRRGVAAAMERAALLVQPSPRETFGVVVAEALATGSPVVAVDSGGVTEIMSPDPSRLGALVAYDPQALAGAILATLDRRSGFDPAALRAYVVERYAAATVGRRIVDLYDEVVSEARGSSGHASSGPASGGRPAGGAAPESSAPATILVAAHRIHLDRALDTLPGRSLGPTLIVTTGPEAPGYTIAPVDPRRVVALARWGTAPAHAATGALPRRLAASVARPVLNRIRRRRHEGAVLAAVRTAVTAAAAEITASRPGGSPPVAVCLGGLDAAAVEPLVAAGVVHPAPGGLRWLLDSRAAEPPPSPASSA